jgi:Helix-turn-helix domain
MAKIPELQPGQRLSGPERDQVGADLLRRYRAGSSIRQICGETGYSIGRVRRLLVDAGVQFRGRGGATRASRGRKSPARS